MPDQKQRNTRKSVCLVEQVFSEERAAQVKVLEQKADIVNNKAAILFQQKLKRKRENKAKAKAEAEKKFKKKKKKHGFQEEWFDRISLELYIYMFWYDLNFNYLINLKTRHHGVVALWL